MSRIAFVGPFGLQPKGTMSVRALPIAKALVAQGHQVSLIIPPWDDPLRAGQRWIDEGVNIIHVTLPIGLPGLFHLELARRMVAEVKRFQPDIVHCFKPKAYAGLTHFMLWSLRALHLFKATLIVDADDWEQAWNAVNNYTSLQKRFFTWQEEWGLRHADVVTVASHTLEHLVMGERGNMQHNVIYLPNGYTAKRDQQPPSQNAADIRQQYQLGESPVILLYSRFAEFRLSRIIHFVAAVAEAMPKTRWLIVGQGFQGEERTLQQQLIQANLAQYVHFAGWVKAELLPSYFQTAQIAIFPYDDTLINRTKCSVKLIELLAAGLPVVADALGQNLEYIQDGQSGLLVPLEDDTAFSQAIIQLLYDPTLRQQLGYAAQQAMHHHFQWAELVKVLTQIYDTK